jgi:hypothetical protein
LTALIIFVAPVVAVPEFLAKYRIHQANLFQMNARGASREAIGHRMAMRGILLEEIRKWLERNGQDLRSADLQSYLKQWTKAQERDSFELEEPSRWRYFRHLLEYPRVYGEIMSARHRLHGYAQAFRGLLMGYSHLNALEKLRRARG